MAQKEEDIRDRVRRINPEALKIMDMVDEEARKLGCSGVSVVTTEDMTEEEEEMALFEGYLKEGYSEDIAAKKAKEAMALIERAFGKNK